MISCSLSPFLSLSHQSPDLLYGKVNVESHNVTHYVRGSVVKGRVVASKILPPGSPTLLPGGRIFDLPLDNGVFITRYDVIRSERGFVACGVVLLSLAVSSFGLVNGAILGRLSLEVVYVEKF